MEFLAPIKCLVNADGEYPGLNLTLARGMSLFTEYSVWAATFAEWGQAHILSLLLTLFG